MIYNLEAEQAVIGSVLLEGSLFNTLTIEAMHFYDSAHQKIFEAIKKVAKKEKNIDLVTVVTELRENINGVGNVSYLSQLADSIPSVASLAFYETAVYEAYRKRKTREVALKYAENPNDKSLDKLVNQLESLKSVGIQENEKNVRDYLMEIAEDMVAPQEVSKRGNLTGFKDFDSMTGGTQPSDLVIIAGRPSIGKTAFALNIGNGHCKNGGMTHLFSLEMSTKQLLQRTISAVGGINVQKWQSMLFSIDDYNKAMNAIGVISNWKMAVHESARTINQIKSSIRKSVQDQPDEKHLVIIDYLQLITTSGRYERKDLEVGAITRDLKLLARELDIPIILLSQLSRGVEQRQDKRPMMSDLRESGNIEQDADVIGLLYRDDYYNKESDKNNIMEVILSKQRNGPTGSVDLVFQKEYGNFLDLSSNDSLT